MIIIARAIKCMMRDPDHPLKTIGYTFYRSHAENSFMETVFTQTNVYVVIQNM